MVLRCCGVGTERGNHSRGTPVPSTAPCGYPWSSTLSGKGEERKGREGVKYGKVVGAW